MLKIFYAKLGFVFFYRSDINYLFTSHFQNSTAGGGDYITMNRLIDQG